MSTSPHAMTVEDSDETLMAAYVGGDRAAFERLFERWAPRLLGLFRRGGLPPDDASDLVQQTFLQLHRARFDFRPGSALRPWLYTIALNLRRQLARRRIRKPEVALDDAPAVPPASGERIDGTKVQEQVRLALDRLPPAYREVIWLHWFEELPFREIATIVGANPTAVRVRAHRGYGKLREILEAAGVTVADLPAYPTEAE